LKKSYIRTRLSAIPECGWHWASIDSTSASANERASSAAKQQHRKDLGEGAQALFHIQFPEEDSQKLILHVFGQKEKKAPS